jgi:ABC-type amino acid transport substrate-binding protein
LLAGVAAAQNPAPPNPDLPARISDTAHLRGGWYPWDPYQYRDYRRGVPILTGFDVEVERALARIMRVELVLPEIAWENHLAALAAGTADIAAGATPSEARSRYAYFSKPYRTETDVLILPRGASGRYPFRTIEQMLETFAREKFRLGVIAGFVYADDRVNAFIADEAHRDQIVPVSNDAQNLQNLLAGVHRRLPRRSHRRRHHGLAPPRRSAYRRASAALLRQHSFHAEPRDADTADARPPQ